MCVSRDPCEERRSGWAFSGTGPSLVPGLLWYRAFSGIGPSLASGLLWHRAFSGTGPSLVPGLLWHRAFSGTGPSLAPGLLWHRAFSGTGPSLKWEQPSSCSCQCLLECLCCEDFFTVECTKEHCQKRRASPLLTYTSSMPMRSVHWLACPWICSFVCEDRSSVDSRSFSPMEGRVASQWNRSVEARFSLCTAEEISRQCCLNACARSLCYKDLVHLVEES